MPGLIRQFTLAAAFILAMGRAEAAALQSPIDNSDPSTIVEEQLRRPQPRESGNDRQATVEQTGRAEVGMADPVLVGAIKVEGAGEIPVAAFAPVINRYVGRTLSPGELRDLTSEIADVARSRGFGIATAWIPQQRLTNGILRVILDEGRIDEVQITGPGAAAMRRTLEPLSGTRPVQTAELERRILLAGDISGVWIVKARLDRNGDGRAILRVTTGRDAVRARLFLDNWGNAEVGPVRARLSLDFNGLIAADDRLTLGGAVTPLQPRELAVISAGYSKPIGGNGTEVRLEGYYAHTRAGGSLKGRDIASESASVNFGLSQALRRSRPSSLWLNLDFEYLTSRGMAADKRFRDDRLATLTAGIFGTAGNDASRVRGRISIRKGLDLLDATEAGMPLASRRDADGVFTKAEFWASYTSRVGPRVSFAFDAQGQLADGPLLLSEEIGLGGRYFLRGYDYREFSGDKGIAGSAEIRFNLATAPRPFRDLTFYGYADAGSVGNYKQGFGSGTLASAGGGVRASFDHAIDLGIEVGVPLVHGAVRGANYDPRLSVTLSKRF